MAPQATQVFPSPVPDFSSGPSKTRSSPRTFGHNVEDVFFAANPLGIKQETAEDSTLISSPRFTPRPASPYFGSFGVSQIHPRPSKTETVAPAAEASSKAPVHALKRSRDDEEVADSVPKRRKRATSNTTQTELSEEETLLLRLKDEENLPWKDIALRFQTDLGKVYQVPALQMRLKRLRERMRVWTEKDVSIASISTLPGKLSTETNPHSSTPSNKPTDTGSNFDSTSSPPRSVAPSFPHLHSPSRRKGEPADTKSRCSTSAPPSAGPPSTAPASGRNCTRTASRRSRGRNHHRRPSTSPTLAVRNCLGRRVRASMVCQLIPRDRSLSLSPSISLSVQSATSVGEWRSVGAQVDPVDPVRTVGRAQTTYRGGQHSTQTAHLLRHGSTQHPLRTQRTDGYYRFDPFILSSGFSFLFSGRRFTAASYCTHSVSRGFLFFSPVLRHLTDDSLHPSLASFLVFSGKKGLDPCTSIQR